MDIVYILSIINSGFLDITEEDNYGSKFNKIQVITMSYHNFNKPLVIVSLLLLLTILLALMKVSL